MKAVKVFMWGELVGAVALDPTLGYYVFQYDSKFCKLGIEPAPLQMPCHSEEPYVFTDLPIPTYKHLPAMLADALPDDFGNALIDAYMAEKGIKASDISALDRLAYMGSRSMGALEFKPAIGFHSRSSFVLELGELVLLAREALHGQLSSEKDAHHSLRHIIEVGTSAGGARAKAVIAINPETGELRSGQVDVPKGFEHWLLKFDGIGKDRELGSSQDYGRIEYAYHLMAIASGIQMSSCRLLEEHGRAHFMTKRFDRDPEGVKHHLQTLCAMSHLDYKKRAVNSYEQYFLTIRQLGLGHAAEVEAFRRMIFNICAKNCDDHTKNFSFIMRHGKRVWELAPAYDLTFAYNPHGEWTYQHLMSVSGKFRDFVFEDFFKLADRFGIGEAKNVISEVQDTVKRWPEFAKLAGLKPDLIRDIGSFHIFV